MPETPEVVIKQVLESKGIEDSTKQVAEHGKAWEHVDTTVGRLGKTVEGLSRRIATLTGAAGIGALIADFVKLENQANRTAIAMGQITGGRAGFDQVRSQAQRAAYATGVPSPQLQQALTNTLGFTGGNYFANQPGRQSAYMRQIGMYAGSYGVDPGALGAIVGQLEQGTRQGPGASSQLLAMLATNAAKGGMEGQLGQYGQTIAGITAAMVAQNPNVAGRGLPGGIADLYNQAIASNPAYRNNPQAFAGGQQAVTSGLQGAFRNPRMEAWLQMAGISYWDQRKGLTDPSVKSRIMRAADRMYGHGTISEDVALRSMFGDLPGADLLENRAPARHATQQDIERQMMRTLRGMQQHLQTPGAQLTRAREGAERQVYDRGGGALSGVFAWSAQHPLLALAAGMGGIGLGMRGAGWALRRGLGHLRGAGAATAAEEAGAEAASSAEATKMATKGATEAGEAAGRGGSLLGRLGGMARIGGRFLGVLGAPFIYHDAHSWAMKHPALAQYSGSRGWGELGRDILHDDESIFDLVTGHHSRQGGTSRRGRVGGNVLGGSITAAGARALGLPQPHPSQSAPHSVRPRLPGDVDETFARAVKQFDAAVRRFSGGRASAAFPGAQGASSPSTGQTPGMQFAAALGGGPGGGGALSQAGPGGGAFSQFMGAPGQFGLSGRASSFGGPEESHRSAMGLDTTKVPGIAVANSNTMGGYWRLRGPDGRTFVTRQIDWGPAAWTGKKFDFDYALMKQLGMRYGTNPGGSGTWHGEYLGKHPATSGRPTVNVHIDGRAVNRSHTLTRGPRDPWNPAGI